MLPGDGSKQARHFLNLKGTESNPLTATPSPIERNNQNLFFVQAFVDVIDRSHYDFFVSYFGSFDVRILNGWARTRPNAVGTAID